MSAARLIDKAPVCSICGGMMRRRDGVLVCDRHGTVAARWEPLARGHELVEIEPYWQEITWPTWVIRGGE